ncbi:MAG: C1 family peptidase [Chitinophagaceae bacterium]|nr:C1 family peptidase [Chitinophagaceae bacterium]
MRQAIFLSLAFAFFIKSSGQNYSLGATYDSIQERIPKVSESFSLGFSGGIPDSFSLKQFCPTPGHQGQIGSCTGWAVGYGAQTILWARTNKITDKNKITASAFSGLYIYKSLLENTDKCERTDACGGCGINIFKAFDFLKANGNIPNRTLTDAEVCKSAVPILLPVNTSLSKINDFAELFTEAEVYNEEYGKDPDKVYKVITKIAEGIPVVIDIRIPKSTNKDVSFWDGEDFDNDFWTPVDSLKPVLKNGHAMVVVGYNIRQKYFEVLNSWGDWPEAKGNGFVKIRFKDFKKYVASAGIMYLESHTAPSLLRMRLQIEDYDRLNNGKVEFNNILPIDITSGVISTNVYKEDIFKIKLSNLPEGYYVKMGSIGSSYEINFPDQLESGFTFTDSSNFTFPAHSVIKALENEFYTVITLTKSADFDLNKVLDQISSDKSNIAVNEKIKIYSGIRNEGSLLKVSSDSIDFKFENGKDIFLIIKIKTRL